MLGIQIVPAELLIQLPPHRTLSEKELLVFGLGPADVGAPVCVVDSGATAMRAALSNVVDHPLGEGEIWVLFDFAWGRHLGVLGAEVGQLELLVDRHVLDHNHYGLAFLPLMLQLLVVEDVVDAQFYVGLSSVLQHGHVVPRELAVLHQAFKLFCGFLEFSLLELNSLDNFGKHGVLLQFEGAVSAVGALVPESLEMIQAHHLLAVGAEPRFFDPVKANNALIQPRFINMPKPRLDVFLITQHSNELQQCILNSIRHILIFKYLRPNKAHPSHSQIFLIISIKNICNFVILSFEFYSYSTNLKAHYIYSGPQIEVSYLSRSIDRGIDRKSELRSQVIYFC